MYQSKIKTSIKGNNNPADTLACVGCGYGCQFSCLSYCEEKCSGGCSAACGESVCSGSCYMNVISKP